MSEEQEKHELIEQMGSEDNATALAAVDQLRLRGWLGDGSLAGVDLIKANLANANLNDAQLHLTNLRLANLDGATLINVNLFGANFINASFKGADLRNAQLGGTKLNSAKLNNTNLLSTNLTGVDFTNADLSGANAIQANLSGALMRFTVLDSANLEAAGLELTSLYRAQLSNANFTRAKCVNTSFAEVDFSDVRGLETVEHLGPSSIDVDTLYQSKGKIPEIFLRGCGVPEDFIELTRGIFRTAIEFYSCFISHSSQDQEFSDLLHGRMRDNNLRVWYALEDLKGGKKTHEQLDRAIKLHDKLILVLSEDSIESGWVQREIRTAVKRERRENRRVLFPISLVPFEALKEWELWDSDLQLDLAQEILGIFHPGLQ